MTRQCVFVLFSYIVVCCAAFSTPLVDSRVGLCYVTNACNTLADQSTTPLNYSSTQVNDSHSISITAFNDVDVTTLVLKNSVSYSEQGAENFYAQVGSSVLIQDAFFTISAPGLDGTPGFLQAQIAVMGMMTGSVLGSAGLAIFSSQLSCSFCGSSLPGGNLTGNLDLSFVTIPLEFQYGTPFDLSFVVGAHGFPESTNNGSADFSAQLNGLFLSDSNGNPVFNGTAVSSGGELVPLLSIPEPRSILLVGIGIAAISMCLAKDRLRNEI